MFVRIMDCNDQILYLEVTPTLGATLFCTFVYGAKNKQARLKILLHLGNMVCKGPWIVFGDFNYMTNVNEHVGQGIRLSEINPLRSYMDV